MNVKLFEIAFVAENQDFSSKGSFLSFSRSYYVIDEYKTRSFVVQPVFLID